MDEIHTKRMTQFLHSSYATKQAKQILSVQLEKTWGKVKI